MSKRSSLLVRGRVRSRSVRLPVACPWLQSPALRVASILGAQWKKHRIRSIRISRSAKYAGVGRQILAWV